MVNKTSIEVIGVGRSKIDGDNYVHVTFNRYVGDDLVATDVSILDAGHAMPLVEQFEKHHEGCTIYNEHAIAGFQ